MLRIGDAAKEFNISNRTLRYWEEEGILESTRAENGYRQYDHNNAIRIKQIVLLRKLKMPIVDIEQIFLSNDRNSAIDTLTNHLVNLKQETILHHSLAILVERLIQRMKTERSLEHVFTLLETQLAVTLPEHPKELQIVLSERNSAMSVNPLDNVRIVRLPAMTVASYRAQSEMPEEDCSKVFNKFVLENNLHKRDGYRYFGFNNPSPTENNPVYGYEMWVTIPEDFQVPEPLQRKKFGGGLYASVSTHMNEIGERWQLLDNWCNNSDKYDMDVSLQWLEECCMDFQAFTSESVSGGEKQLDLLAPVKER